ncbi:MAG: hypothetical protein WCU88_13750 [Elusimicrobiota bacterium]|jgi:hypothetical protein
MTSRDLTIALVIPAKAGIRAVFALSLFLLCAFLPFQRAQAMGLSTTMGRVFIGNVPLGSTVSLRDLSGISYKITNTSLNAEDVEVSVLPPGKDEGILEPGYEIIPDCRWMWLSQHRFHLAPGQQGVADVIINIPKDVKHLGKKYQVSLWARSVTAGRFLAVGLKSRVMLEISPRLMTLDEIKRSDEIVDSLDFHFSPADMTLEDFPLGKTVNVKERYKKNFKLINLSDKPMRVHLKWISRGLSGLSSMPNVIDDVGSVTPEKTEMTIPANSIGLVAFSTKLPNDPSLAGKKVRLILQAELQDQPVSVSAFGQIIMVGEKGGGNP